MEETGIFRVGFCEKSVDYADEEGVIVDREGYSVAELSLYNAISGVLIHISRILALSIAQNVCKVESYTKLTGFVLFPGW